ncbi:MAG: redoxin domain-containing protein [Chitinophagaceae bacterium]|nr:redoxin domain-containing protein [Chitinophagaceae bacterium]
MKKQFSSLLTLLIFFLSSCSVGQSQKANMQLNVNEFSEKIKALPTALILDVRTADEFSKGHLENAINIDWYSAEFKNRISVFDKTKPVMVYCLSGGRSAEAANVLRNEGFKEVYEMNGGIMKWRAANLPLTTQDANKPTQEELTQEQFATITGSYTMVLVDFYADWCAPCKQMKPYLDEINETMKDKVKVVRINVDDNQQLCKDLKIDALPVLHLYKNNKLVWSNVGFIGKEDVLKKLQ